MGRLFNKKPILFTRMRQGCEWLTAFVSSGLFLKITFLWFVVQGVFFALTTRVGLPPDENYHLAFIGVFADSLSPFVTNQADYLALGEIVRTPFFLYHYLFGFIYAVVGSGEHSVYILRLLNLVIGIGSLYLTHKIANELKLSKLVRNLSLFILSSTLMFVFLAAAVSYDNLFIFLSLASVLLLIKLLDKITPHHLLLLAVVLAAGVLVKVNFLVIAFAVMAILIIKYFRDYKKIWQDFTVNFNNKQRLNILLSVILIFLSVLIVHRYGYNLVKYHTYAPACTQVQSLEDCRQNALFARNEKVFGEWRQTPDKDPFEYVYDWLPLVQDRTYGVYGHEELSPFRITSLWLQLFALVTIVAVVRLWNKKDRLITVVGGIVLLYVLAVLMENYRIFLDSGRFGFVVHGRYLFAVLPILYIIGLHYLFKMFNSVYARAVVVVISLVMFAVSALPTYLIKINPEWIQPAADQPVQIIKDWLP